MRTTTVAAPLALFASGVLRWIGGEPAGEFGRFCFFGSMVLFGVLAVMLCRRVPAGRPLAYLATASALSGIVCTLWTIGGDLVGPTLFVLGMVVLLSLRVAAGRMPAWSPVLFFAGYAAVSVDPGLLPVAALVILAAVAPLDRRHDAVRAAGSAPATLAGSLSRRG